MVQLMTSQALVRRCVWCHVNSGTMVGLLLPYPMEAKERCTKLLDMRLVPPTLNVYVTSVGVTCLLSWTVLARSRWSQSLNTRGQPLYCPWWVVMLSMRYSQYTRHRELRNVRTTSEIECPISLVPTVMPHSNSNNSHLHAISRLVAV
jgi:hypothetical protein